MLVSMPLLGKGERALGGEDGSVVRPGFAQLFDAALKQGLASGCITTGDLFLRLRLGTGLQLRQLLPIIRQVKRATLGIRFLRIGADQHAAE